MHHRCFLFSLLAVVLAGCAEATGPGVRLQVELEVSSDAVHPDDPVEVVVTVANAGSEVATVNAGGCPQLFTVLTGDGRAVGPEGILCAASLQLEDLAPGEKLTFRYTWAGGSNRSDIRGPFTSVPPGDYWLQGHAAAEGGPFLSVPVPIRVE